MKHSLINESDLFLGFFRQRYNFIHNSNVFLRDIQFAIISFYKLRDVKISASNAELAAVELLNKLCDEEKLIRLSNNTWKVNFIFIEGVD